MRSHASRCASQGRALCIGQRVSVPQRPLLALSWLNLPCALMAAIARAGPPFCRVTGPGQGSYCGCGGRSLNHAAHKARPVRPTEGKADLGRLGVSDPATEVPVVGHLPGLQKVRHGLPHDKAQPLIAQSPSSSRAIDRTRSRATPRPETRLPGAAELPRRGRTRSASRLATSTPSITIRASPVPITMHARSRHTGAHLRAPPGPRDRGAGGESCRHSAGAKRRGALAILGPQ
jgi:hypothetical protein